MKSNIGVIGSGDVAKALATGFLRHGYEVLVGSRDPSKLSDWKSKAGAKAQTGNFADAAKFGEIIVLAVAGRVAEEALKVAGLSNLDGKVIIDATNPIAADPPSNGVLSYFTNINKSLMEELQTLAPKAHFVKCFSCVGNALMVNPDLPGGPPTMFICGNNEEAKASVKQILDEFGWEVEDLGKVEAARAIEPLCILWCIPGFLHNDWSHALKLLRR